MNIYEIISFIIYFIAMTAIGVYFFFKDKNGGEKEYFLGGRQMGGWVSALSAGASDMSAWVLMGLPGAIYLSGMNQIWISIGLIIGTVLAWTLIAPRLRHYAILANDAITVPEFLSNRFKSKSPTLRVSCAVVFVVGYLVYAASSVYACGNLFALIVPSETTDMRVVGMIVFSVIILAYTLLGGFNAVCWTDFFQGMLMLCALMIVPIIAYIITSTQGIEGGAGAPDANYYSLLVNGEFNWTSVANIITGLGWGLGYFGMPHIIVRYMSIKSKKEMRKSQIVGSTWTFLILTMTTIMALVARDFLTTPLTSGDKELVFAYVVRGIFGVGPIALIGGFLISAILAASMSTADSQLLASSSAFASDIYKTTINKKADDKKVLSVGRYAVIGVTLIAFGLAMMVHFLKLTDLMGLVSAAWSIFGAAFSPVIILSLFWRRFNYQGAISSIIAGFVGSILWMVLFNLEYYGFNSLIAGTGLYELVPGFIIGIATGVMVSLLTKAPDKEVTDLFDKFKAVKGDEDLVCEN
ncbi:MAG: sodium/proline symporter [Clostridia bacterium]|nr:sodium/proline symporter [Clostridia bacterium]